MIFKELKKKVQLSWQASSPSHHLRRLFCESISHFYIVQVNPLVGTKLSSSVKLFCEQPPVNHEYHTVYSSLTSSSIKYRCVFSSTSLKRTIPSAKTTRDIQFPWNILPLSVTSSITELLTVNRFHSVPYKASLRFCYSIHFPFYHILINRNSVPCLSVCIFSCSFFSLDNQLTVNP